MTIKAVRPMRVDDLNKIDKEVGVKLEMTPETTGYQEFTDMVRVAGDEKTLVAVADLRQYTWFLYSKDGHSLSGRRIPTSWFK